MEPYLISGDDKGVKKREESKAGSHNAFKEGVVGRRVRKKLKPEKKKGSE